MENNEDKRTPVQAEIERLQTELSNLTIPFLRDKTDYAITVLQSLLEPEKEALIKKEMEVQKLRNVLSKAFMYLDVNSYIGKLVIQTLKETDLYTSDSVHCSKTWGGICTKGCNDESHCYLEHQPTIDL
jgi:hypothetical protein